MGNNCDSLETVEPSFMSFMHTLACDLAKAAEEVRNIS